MNLMYCYCIFYALMAYGMRLFLIRFQSSLKKRKGFLILKKYPIDI